MKERRKAMKQKGSRSSLRARKREGMSIITRNLKKLEKDYRLKMIGQKFYLLEKSRLKGIQKKERKNEQEKTD